MRIPYERSTGGDRNRTLGAKAKSTTLARTSWNITKVGSLLPTVTLLVATRDGWRIS